MLEQVPIARGLLQSTKRPVLIHSQLIAYLYLPIHSHLNVTNTKIFTHKSTQGTGFPWRKCFTMRVNHQTRISLLFPAGLFLIRNIAATTLSVYAKCISKPSMIIVHEDSIHELTFIPQIIVIFRILILT